MIKPKFYLKIKGSVSVIGKPNSKAEASVKRKFIDLKEKQIQDAGQWCKDNQKRGHSVLKIGCSHQLKNPGTIDQRLDGKTANLKKEHLQILTNDEESSVEELVKNKNICHQGTTQKQITSLILDILKIRDHCNKKVTGGRKFQKLSADARHVLQTGKYEYILMFFITLFQLRQPHILIVFHKHYLN